MELRSAAEIAKAAGVTASAVTQYIKNNAIEPAEVQGHKKFYDVESGPMVDYISGGERSPGNEWDFLYKKARAEKLQIANQKSLNELISRKVVSLLLGRIYSVHTSVLTPLSSKVVGLQAAEAKIKDPKIILKMGEIMDDEIYDALSAIKRLLLNFNESLKNGEIEEVDEPEIPEDEPKKQTRKPKKKKK